MDLPPLADALILGVVEGLTEFLPVSSTGHLIIVSDFLGLNDEMTWKDALVVGIAQCFALIPGTSRSGATIMGGMLFGLSRGAATEFSFFLAVPIMFAATGYQLVKYRSLLSADDLGVFAVGFVVS